MALVPQRPRVCEEVPDAKDHQYELNSPATRALAWVPAPSSLGVGWCPEAWLEQPLPAPCMRPLLVPALASCALLTVSCLGPAGPPLVLQPIPGVEAEAWVVPRPSFLLAAEPLLCLGPGPAGLLPVPHAT